jgi:hypothetical protein
MQSLKERKQKSLTGVQEINNDIIWSVAMFWRSH